MSWFSNGVSIDERVEKATSENLPSGEQDLALNLEICDLIRSKTVQPKDAMRALKRRMLQKNPNVQILTLHLTDICIKNGGSHFLTEVASREFMDTLVIVLKPASGQPPLNSDVKTLLLEYIQSWAHAFEGQLQLSYVKKVYEQLKSEGFEFPSASKMSSSFIDSSAPPEWVDSDTCMKSGVPFSFTNRKHHCRNCGGVYIQKHCNNYIALRHYGINEPVRVCDDCYTKLKPKGSRYSSPAYHSPSVSAKLRVSNNSDLNPFRAQEDADLQRALKMSLEASNGNGGRAPSNWAPASTKGNQLRQDNDDDSEDEDMKAALAASLRDMGANNSTNNNNNNNINKSASSDWYSDANISASDSQAQKSSYSELPLQKSSQLPNPNDMSHLEVEVISMYIHAVNQLQKQPPGTILRDAKLQQLNETVMLLRPKFANALKTAVDKFEAFQDIHGKLTAVTRYYDRLLESSINYSSHRNYGYPQQQPQYPQYTGGPMGESQPPLHSQGTGSSNPSYLYQQSSGQYPVPVPSSGNANPPYGYNVPQPGSEYPPQPNSGSDPNAAPVDYSQPPGPGHVMQFQHTSDSDYAHMTPSAPPFPSSNTGSYPPSAPPSSDTSSIVPKKEEVNLIDL